MRVGSSNDVNWIVDELDWQTKDRTIVSSE
jgi:hypothetical protein